MDVPKDVQNALYEYTAQKPVEKDPVPAVNDSEIEKAIEMILAAEKPYIYIGGGAITDDARCGSSGSGRKDRRTDRLHHDGHFRSTVLQSPLAGHGGYAWTLCLLHCTE